jgi:hypothetical protein
MNHSLGNLKGESCLNKLFFVLEKIQKQMLFPKFLQGKEKNAS